MLFPNKEIIFKSIKELKVIFFQCLGKRQWDADSVANLANCMCSVECDSETLQTVARQPPLPMEFSRQEYWSGLSFPSPEDLPNIGIKPKSPELQTDSFFFFWPLYYYYFLI